MDEDIKDTLEEIFENETFDVTYIRKDFYMVSKKDSTTKIFYNYNKDITFNYNISKLANLIEKIMLVRKEVTK